MILIPDVFLLKTVIYQSRLTQTSWRNQCHIASIGQMAGKKSCFLYPITEVFRRKLFCVRRPIGFRSPPNRIPYAARSDSVRRPIGFRTPSNDYL